MIVVADSGPLHYLILLQHVDLLRRFYGQVLVPEPVANELVAAGGRVGRSAAAKRLDDEPVQLAVVAHVRHDETHYDELLARGVERRDARDRVREDVTVCCHGAVNDDPALRPAESREQK